MEDTEGLASSTESSIELITSILSLLERKADRGIKCIVPGCKNYSGINKEVTWHKFPRDTSTRKEWIRRVRNLDRFEDPVNYDGFWDPTEDHRICGAHFRLNGRKRQDDKFPTIFPWTIDGNLRQRKKYLLRSQREDKNLAASRDEDAVTGSLAGHTLFCFLHDHAYFDVKGKKMLVEFLTLVYKLKLWERQNKERDLATMDHFEIAVFKSLYLKLQKMRNFKAFQLSRWLDSTFTAEKRWKVMYDKVIARGNFLSNLQFSNDSSRDPLEITDEYELANEECDLEVKPEPEEYVDNFENEIRVLYEPQQERQRDPLSDNTAEVEQAADGISENEPTVDNSLNRLERTNTANREGQIVARKKVRRKKGNASNVKKILIVPGDSHCARTRPLIFRKQVTSDANQNLVSVARCAEANRRKERPAKRKLIAPNLVTNIKSEVFTSEQDNETHESTELGTVERNVNSEFDNFIEDVISGAVVSAASENLAPQQEQEVQYPKEPPTRIQKHPTPREWTEEEDRRLTTLVGELGQQNWRDVVRFMQRRQKKDCMQRWFHHLRPTIRKRKWTAKEDSIIREAHRELGNNWYKIAKLLPGKTVSAIRHRWKKLSKTCETENRTIVETQDVQVRRCRPEASTPIAENSVPVPEPSFLPQVRTIQCEGVTEGARENWDLPPVQSEYSDRQEMEGMQGMLLPESDVPEDIKPQVPLYFEDSKEHILSSTWYQSTQDPLLQTHLLRGECDFALPKITDLVNPLKESEADTNVRIYLDASVVTPPKPKTYYNKSKRIVKTSTDVMSPRSEPEADAERIVVSDTSTNVMRTDSNTREVMSDTNMDETDPLCENVSTDIMISPSEAEPFTTFNAGNDGGSNHAASVSPARKKNYGWRKKRKCSRKGLMRCSKCRKFFKPSSIFKQVKKDNSFSKSCPECLVIEEEEESCTGIQCFACEKPLSSESELVEHLQVDKNDEKLYRCRICNMSFQSKQCYAFHSESHSETDPAKTTFACDVCEQEFFELQNLEAHIIIHKWQLRNK